MPIVFHKLDGFPGQIPWGLSAVSPITKPRLKMCGLGLESSLISAAQAALESMGKGLQEAEPGPVAEHPPQPRLPAQPKVHKAEVSPRDPDLGYFSLLC